jgi:predicted RNA-binding protein with PUA domain
LFYKNLIEFIKTTTHTPFFSSVLKRISKGSLSEGVKITLEQEKKSKIENKIKQYKKNGKLTTGPKIIDFPKRFSFTLFT